MNDLALQADIMLALLVLTHKHLIRLRPARRAICPNRFLLGRRGRMEQRSGAAGVGGSGIHIRHDYLLVFSVSVVAITVLLPPILRAIITPRPIAELRAGRVIIQFTLPNLP